ncbi:MAG: hypothetical protein Roseis2KO_55600 [Roseivirga sp.]
MTRKIFTAFTLLLIILTACNQKEKFPESLANGTSYASLSGEFSYSEFMFTETLTLSENQTFMMSKRSDLGDSFTSGKWTWENDKIRLSSNLKYKPPKKPNQNLPHDSLTIVDLKIDTTATMLLNFMDSLDIFTLPEPGNDTVYFFVENLTFQITSSGLKKHQKDGTHKIFKRSK